VGIIKKTEHLVITNYLNPEALILTGENRQK